jgi:hypothetical protein
MLMVTKNVTSSCASSVYPSCYSWFSCYLFLGGTTDSGHVFTFTRCHDLLRHYAADAKGPTTGLMRPKHHLYPSCSKLLHGHRSLICIHDLNHLFLAKPTPTTIAPVVVVEDLDAMQLWKVRLVQLLKPG